MKVILVAGCVVLAAPTAAEEWSFPRAWERLHSDHAALHAARAEERQRAEEQRAARSLYFPRLDAEARATRLDQPIVIDLEPIRSVLLQLNPRVPPAAVPPFIQPVQDERFWRADLRLQWPLYTGGRVAATHAAARAQVSEARAAREALEGSLASQLVARYFGVRLAARAGQVRADVLEAMQRHAFEARRLEEEGQIARVERLHAEVALAEARRQWLRAQRDAELARAALANLLASAEPAEAASPLFVSEQLEPLASFLEAARAGNAGVRRLQAAAEAAHQGVRAERGRRLPELYAFGLRELHERDLTLLDPAWAVGLGLRLNLFDGAERASRVAAARAREERVRRLEEQAGRDVALLVERRYREAENAREQLAALGAARELAEEGVRVRSRAFGEGLATSIEVVDARLALARVQLERLAASYDFVTALAGLLEATGQSDRFEQYRATGREVEP